MVNGLHRFNLQNSVKRLIKIFVIWSLSPSIPTPWVWCKCHWVKICVWKQRHNNNNNNNNNKRLWLSLKKLQCWRYRPKMVGSHCSYPFYRPKRWRGSQSTGPSKQISCYWCKGLVIGDFSDPWCPLSTITHGLQGTHLKGNIHI